MPHSVFAAPLAAALSCRAVARRCLKAHSLAVSSSVTIFFGLAALRRPADLAEEVDDDIDVIEMPGNGGGADSRDGEADRDCTADDVNGGGVAQPNTKRPMRSRQ